MFLVYPAAPPPYFPYSYPTTRSDVGCTVPLGAVYFTKGKMEPYTPWHLIPQTYRMCVCEGYERPAEECRRTLCEQVTLIATPWDYEMSRKRPLKPTLPNPRKAERTPKITDWFQAVKTLPLETGTAVDACFDSSEYWQEEQDAYDRFGSCHSDEDY